MTTHTLKASAPTHPMEQRHRTPREEPPTRYTTGDLARLTGNTLRTVRYYEELGLLSPGPRQHGEHRLFTTQDLERLRTITDLRAVGLSLEEVATVLNVQMHAPQGSLRLEQACHLLDDQLLLVRDRIATLQRVEKQLAEARGALDHCRTCNKLGHPENCHLCGVGETAKDNTLVDILIHQEVAMAKEKQTTA